jgi:hypothetical protein
MVHDAQSVKAAQSPFILSNNLDTPRPNDREPKNYSITVLEASPERFDGIGDAGRKSGVVDVIVTRLKGSSIVAVSYQVGERKGRKSFPRAGQATGTFWAVLVDPWVPLVP